MVSTADLKRAWLLRNLGLSSSELSTADLEAALYEDSYVPGTTLGFAKKESPHSTTVSPQDVPDLQLQVEGTGRSIDIELFVPMVYHSAVNTFIRGELKQDGVIVNFGWTQSTSAAFGPSLYVKHHTAVLTKGQMYTFTVAMWHSAAGTQNFFAAAGRPMWLKATA